MIEKLRMINNRISESTLDKKVKKRHSIIKKILEDDDCFLKMDIEIAYGILRDLLIEEDKLKMVYMALIDKKEANSVKN